MGCADIAKKVSRAIAIAPNASIVAVASREAGKARRFIADNALPAGTKAYGSYEALIEDEDIEAVYMPLPTSLHVRWAVAAAVKRKHVLLEKPTALVVSDLDKILEACEHNGVQFMDGTMWMHHPRTARMKQVLSDPDLIGRIQMIHSTRAFSATPEFLETNIRIKPDLDSLGALGDLGWYCIGAILWAVDYQLPSSTTALPTVPSNKSGVILACAASLQWDDGKVATFHCTFLCNTAMDISIQGTSGSLHVADFVIPYQEDSASFELITGAHFAELHIGWSKTPDEVLTLTNLPQETLMVQEFARLVGLILSSGGRPDPKWPDTSRKTQLVMDAVKKSIDLGFKPVAL
ncbi:D-xylose 1-dehydrogenase (NADP(+)) protein [Dioscorea alata]|uniref:D-xylose 1-dehydrogenase (NADP(+)) protein n=1 Tax=Dioscorea alata TaxID=55571 RepID=A0ACB7W851_DIOAL|nr:D-xylose 1-dehydrogenase (NADP(+)) protein [Dioscorea alata]